MPRVLARALLCSGIGSAVGQAETARFTVADARLLVANTPDYLRAKKAGGCPQLKVLWSDERSIGIQARDHCARAGAGSIGSYFIDIRSAVVWADVDHKVPVTSPRLARVSEELRRKLRDSAKKKK